MQFLNEHPMTAFSIHPHWSRLWNNTNKAASSDTLSQVWAAFSPTSRICDTIRRELDDSLADAEIEVLTNDS